MTAPSTGPGQASARTRRNRVAAGRKAAAWKKRHAERRAERGLAAVRAELASCGPEGAVHGSETHRIASIGEVLARVKARVAKGAGTPNTVSPGPP